MAIIKTSIGFLEYQSHLLFLNNHRINIDVTIDILRQLSIVLDKIAINWGPAFGTLIGIIRNDSLLPWASTFNIYILKEDEERFKDVLWKLVETGFNIVRYERRGIYYLEKEHEFFKIFVLHKISPDIRHTGGTDFIHEKYLQNTVKWNFKGILLNVPEELDEYLTFHYGNWTEPQKYDRDVSLWHKYSFYIKTWIQDHLPDFWYYEWLYRHRQRNFKVFKQLCQKNRLPVPIGVELSVIHPRKRKRIFTVGVFDLIHKGHVQLFKRAKALGDYLIVAVQEGDYILKYKPDSNVLNSTDDRLMLVQSIRYVDETVTYQDVDDIVKKVDFDVFVTGPDQCHSGFQKAIQWCEMNGREHLILGRTDGVSSSGLKSKLKKNSN